MCALLNSQTMLTSLNLEPYLSLLKTYKLPPLLHANSFKKTEELMFKYFIIYTYFIILMIANITIVPFRKRKS